jgi:hypothetical protein
LYDNFRSRGLIGFARALAAGNFLQQQIPFSENGAAKISMAFGRSRIPESPAAEFPAVRSRLPAVVCNCLQFVIKLMDFCANFSLGAICCRQLAGSCRQFPAG